MISLTRDCVPIWTKVTTTFSDQKVVGHWVIGDNAMQIGLAKKPNWLGRLVAYWLFDVIWEDA